MHLQYGIINNSLASTTHERIMKPLAAYFLTFNMPEVNYASRVVKAQLDEEYAARPRAVQSTHLLILLCDADIS